MPRKKRRRSREERAEELRRRDDLTRRLKARIDELKASLEARSSQEPRRESS
jgi:hypothetical protein